MKCQRASMGFFADHIAIQLAKLARHSRIAKINLETRAEFPRQRRGRPPAPFPASAWMPNGQKRVLLAEQHYLAQVGRGRGTRYAIR